jgi:hypothetical protein
VDAVEVVDPAAITDADAALAGHRDADAVRARLAGDDSLPTYRVELSWVGEDPRIALREDDDLSDDDVAAIAARLQRMDRASPHGPWTVAALEAIAANPEVRAGDLAAAAGRERLDFKRDIRKLKALGLTLSYPVGYRLSPRGEAFLARIR